VDDRTNYCTSQQEQIQKTNKSLFLLNPEQRNGEKENRRERNREREKRMGPYPYLPRVVGPYPFPRKESLLQELGMVQELGICKG